MPDEDYPIPVAVLETTKLYDNKDQVMVANELVHYLNTISRRNENRIEDTDAMRAAIVASTKFAVQTYYENNRRQFNEEHKKQILDFVSAILDTQLNVMNYAQLLSH